MIDHRHLLPEIWLQPKSCSVTKGMPRTGVFLLLSIDCGCKISFRIDILLHALFSFMTLHSSRRKYYRVFSTAGCVLDGVRYSGEKNKSLKRIERAKRFTKYLQVCCNLHHGKDHTYLHRVFFKSSLSSKQVWHYPFPLLPAFTYVCIDACDRNSSSLQKREVVIKTYLLPPTKENVHRAQVHLIQLHRA